MMVDRGMLDYVLARIRPQIQADGGDVEVTEIDDDEGIVYVALKGACVDCPLSALTLSQGIERVLVEHVPGVTRVLPDMKATPAMSPLGLNDDDDDDDDDENLDIFGRRIKVTKVDADGNIVEESTM